MSPLRAVAVLIMSDGGAPPGLPRPGWVLGWRGTTKAATPASKITPPSIHGHRRERFGRSLIASGGVGLEVVGWSGIFPFLNQALVGNMKLDCARWREHSPRIVEFHRLVHVEQRHRVKMAKV